MQDVFEQVKELASGQVPFCTATVIRTWRSAPRAVGASMLITADQQVYGSVSGGCVEGDVIKQSRAVLATGEARVLRYGISNDQAWTVGLSCGGAIKVFLQPFLGQQSAPGPEIWQRLQAHMDEDRSCLLVSSLQSRPQHALLSVTDATIGSMDRSIEREALAHLPLGKSTLLEQGDPAYFLHAFPKKNHLIIVGAAHMSVDLVTLAQQQGFQVTVIDPRGIFTDSLKALCRPQDLIRAWPEQVLLDLPLDGSTYAVMLTHDPKIDDQALHILLPRKVKYIGALGSRKTHQKRVARLQEAGVAQELIDRIHAPVGLDIDAQSPAEIALSIMAEMVQVKNAGV